MLSKPDTSSLTYLSDGPSVYLILDVSSPLACWHRLNERGCIKGKPKLVRWGFMHSFKVGGEGKERKNKQQVVRRGSRVPQEPAAWMQQDGKRSW